MFKIVKNREFTHSVPVMVPSDGGHTEETLRCRYRAVAQSDLMEFDLATADGTMGWLRSVCVSFDDVVDEAGAPIPMSDQLRDDLLSVSFIQIALIRHYTLAMSKARLGN